jgi:drug/metabolite transporter (DMT)-like permease
MRLSNLQHFAVCVAIWSTTWIAITFQVAHVAPEVSVAWRFGIASAVLVIYCRWRGYPLRTTWIAQRELFAMGSLMFCLGYLFIYRAETYLVSGLVALGYSASPLINMLASRLAFGTAIGARVTLGGVMGLTGIACVFWPELARIEADNGVLYGAAFTAAGVLASSAGNVFSSRAQRNGLNVWQTMTWAMAWGAALSAAVAIIGGESLALEPGTAYLLALVYLALPGSILSFASYLTLIETIGAARAGYVGVIVPIVALVISSFFEHFHWHPLAYAGVAIAICGNVVILRQAKPVVAAATR